MINAALPRPPVLAAAGAISGTLYALWVIKATEKIGRIGDAGSVLDLISHHAGAGIFYAVIVGAILQRAWKFEAWRWALWVVGAGLCYAAAYRLAIYLYGDSPDDLTPANFAVGAIAGLVGAGLLGALSAALFPPLRLRRLVIMGAAVGALVGLALPLALRAESLLGWMAFFAVWQAAYAVASTRA